MKFEGKALVITIPLDSNDLEETDFDVFLKEVAAEESAYPTCLEVRIGRPISEEESEIVRMFEIGAERFEARIINRTQHDESLAHDLVEKVSTSLG